MPEARVIAVVLGCAAVLSYGFWHHTVYQNGYKAAQEECKAEVAKAQQLADKIAADKQDKITTIATKHIKQAAESQRVVDSNIAKVDQYAPTDFPPLPGSFRMFHDAAATGEEVGDPAGIDAASVSLRATAETVARNYASCNYDKSRLMVLQQVVRVLNGEANGNEKDGN